MNADTFRFAGERVFAESLQALIPPQAPEAPPNSGRIRRSLMSASLLLSENSAAEIHAAARQSARKLGISVAVEIYRARGAENASIHLCEDPVLLEIESRLLPLLGPDTLVALSGHELGHHLAHGPDDPHRSTAAIADRLLASESTESARLDLARRLWLSRELTADRFALVACGHLPTVLRLEMVRMTGMPDASLHEATAVHLEQSRQLMASLQKSDAGGSALEHAAHSLRAWALWLFSETDIFRELSGSGPGTRRLHDVDATLLRVLGLRDIALGHPGEFEGETLPEVHECALAAAVLVAHADGELHESETLAIERIFSPLLPDWRELLDPDEALPRLQQLAPIVHAQGASAQRTLFMLLTQVLLAEGPCPPGEIQALLGVGAVLGCQDLFRKLLPAVLQTADMDIDVLDGDVHALIPMPAEARQVSMALKAFFDRACERGGGSVTTRRLLRLCGSPRNTSATWAQLQQAARNSGLELEAAPGQALDTRHPLRRLLPHVDSSPAATFLPGSSVASELRKALQRLRDKLVSGDSRSPSIRLRAARNGRAFDLHQLEGVSSGLAERTLEQVSAGEPIELFDGRDVSHHASARRAEAALIALDRAYRARREESGADELRVGYPFLTGVIGGYLIRAPLILYPARVYREHGRLFVSGRHDESASVNQALLRLLMRQKRKPCPDPLIEAADAAAAGGPYDILAFLQDHGIALVPAMGELQAFRDRSEELDHWREDRLEIEDCAVLGLFPQSGSDVLQDYDELLTQLGSAPEPASLLGTAIDLLPAQLRSQLEPGPDVAIEALAAAPVPVVPIDPAQTQVLNEARRQRTLVVDGPPGTGKSQIIVNLVAEALARGEKVAIVSEKRAALDTVASRLEALGLRSLLALVHDPVDDRRPLYQQLVQRVESDPLLPEDHSVSTARELADLGHRLDAFGRMLRQSAAGISLGQAYTLFAGIEAPLVNTVNGLHQVPYARIGILCEALREQAPYLSLWQEDSPWHGPAGSPPRADFAAMTREEAVALFGAMRAAAAARIALETATNAAHCPASTAAVQMIARARPGLQAVIGNRRQRRDVTERLAFCDLFNWTQTADADLGRLNEALNTAHRLEQAYAMAGLTPDSATQAHIAQASVDLDTATELLQQCQGDEIRAALSLWLHEPDRATLVDALESASRLFRRFQADLDAVGGRVSWRDDDAFLKACATISASAASGNRWLSPGWWLACRRIRQHLREQWPAQDDAPVDLPLLDRIEQRRNAAQAWQALDALQRLFGWTRLDDLSAARQALADIRLARDSAERLALAEPALRDIHLWPPPQDPTAWEQWATRIASAQSVMPATVEARHALDTLRQRLPSTPLEPTTQSLGALRDQLRTIMTITAQRSALAAIKAWPGNRINPETLQAWDLRLDLLGNVLQTASALQSRVKPLSKSFPWLALETSQGQWRVMLERFANDFPSMSQSDRLLAQQPDLRGAVRVCLRALARQRGLPPDQWADTIRKNWAWSVIQHIESGNRDTSTASMFARQEDQLGGFYRELFERARQQQVEQVLRVQAENEWLQEAQAGNGERRSTVRAVKEAMVRDAGRLRQLTPLRTFVRRYARQGLMDALPVWLISPETMALLFPRDALFDLTIIDEASQCPVEHGVPVMVRSRRVVIIGDQHQIPPTEFFRTSQDAEEIDDLDPRPRERELRDGSSDLLDAESLMLLARDRASHAALRWHYRSQQEELIAFSNQAIYGAQLLTVPSTASPLASPAVQWHHVEDAIYRDGANLSEAVQVVALLDRLLAAHHAPTVGIITFNQAQQRAVLNEIDTRRQSNPIFSARYERALARERIDERPFVKTIEHVQGDERDVVIFSIGHPPRDRQRRDGRRERHLAPHFGLVGLPAGEHRLNVAVSRARQTLHVVCSFEPSQLSIAHTRHEGPRLLRNFLEYTHALANGRRAEADAVLLQSRPPQAETAPTAISEQDPQYVPLKVQLRLALEQLGYRSDLDIGQSGFRIPLAVIDRREPRRYRVAVLCSEGNSESDIRTEHLHLPAVLAQRGWQVERVNARDWALHRKSVLQRIVSRCQD